MNQHIIKSIEFELNKAKHKHPDFPKDCRHQLAALSEEAGEVAQAINNYVEGKGDRDAIFEELSQTAAVCIRMLEAMQEPGGFLR